MMQIYLLIKLVFLVVFSVSITQFKYSFRTSLIVILAVNLFIYTISCVIYSVKGYAFLGYVLPLVSSLPSYICFMLLSKHSASKVLFSFFAVCNFGMIKSYFGYLSFLVIPNLAVRLFVESVGFLLILLLIFKIFRKPYFKILNTLDKGWGILCLVPILLNAISYILVYSPVAIISQPISIGTTLTMIATMIAYYIALFLNFENISEYFQLKQDKKVMLLLTDMQKKGFDAIMEKMDIIQLYRHDMRHHIDAINTLLQDGNNGEAQKYLSKLSVSLNKTVVEHYCENYGINAILSSYIKKAEQEHIEIKCEVNIPKECKIDEIELGAVFANAIENAIHACEKIEDQSNRKITIVCKENGEQMCIQISNTFEGEVLFNGDFPVSNDKDHGFGTRSIASIAQKHEGIFSFTAQDGIFKSSVILNR